MRNLDSFDFEDKKVILRVDFNVPLDEAGNIKDDSRIRAALPTINHLLDQNVKQLFIMSHLGEPEGKIIDRLRLDKVGEKLKELLEKPVYKTNDCVLKRVPAERIILLENLRFYEQETQNDDEFAKQLASYAEIYVNDAFGVCHRKHASVHAITKFLPGCIGYLIEKEIASLDMDNMKKPIYAVLGGSKLKTKIPLIQQMMVKADKVMIGGAMVFTFYAAHKLEVGESLVDKEYVRNAEMMAHNEKLIIPDDVVVADCESRSVDIKNVSSTDIPKKSIGLDIGERSIARFKKELEGAGTVIWNGPLGYYEKPPFDKATREIAKYIAGLNCDKVIGGGDTADIVHAMGIEGQFTFISSGGGAALELLSGEQLIALKALEESSR